MRHPRIYGQYAMVYILDGAGSYRDACGYHQRLRSGDLILVFPELEHIYNPDPGTFWVTSYLCFSGPVFDLWRKLDLLDHRHPIHHLSPIDLWNRRFEGILGPSRQSGFNPTLTETCRLQEFLSQIVMGAGQSNTHQADTRWIARACRLIENLSSHENGWSSVAQQLGTNPDSFRRRFKRLTGQSPVKFQIGRSIDRACELIQEGSRSNREIADLLGFCDEFYFSRKFKEITGKSPRAFRNSLPPQLPNTARAK